MAIEIDIPLGVQQAAGIAPLAIDLPNAYIKVTSVVWHFQPEEDTATGEITFTAALWASKDARKSGAHALAQRQFTLRRPDLKSDVLAQCYGVINEVGSFGNFPLDDAKNV